MGLLKIFEALRPPVSEKHQQFLNTPVDRLVRVYQANEILVGSSAHLSDELIGNAISNLQIRARQAADHGDDFEIPDWIAELLPQCEALGCSDIDQALEGSALSAE